MQKIVVLIKRLCRLMEDVNDVRIVFAVESGSRAWGMESSDSDYDVRFVYARPLSEYLRIDRPGDVLEAYYDLDGDPCKPKGAAIDMVGFDVFKYAALLSKSNPAAIEWLLSGTVYCGEQNKAFREYAEKGFSPESLFYHYRSMAKTNYERFIKPEKKSTTKIYLYVYRGIVNAKWIESKGTLPPMEYPKALSGMRKALPQPVVERIEGLLKEKKAGGERDGIKDAVLDGYAEEFFSGPIHAPEARKKTGVEELNTEVRKIILRKTGTL
jgi:predicted nucleotidyltransferase